MPPNLSSCTAKMLKSWMPPFIQRKIWDTRNQGKKLNVLSYPAYQQIALLVPEKLTADLRYHMAIDFQAKLADGFKGFYKSTYWTRGGETRIIAVTDFEPTKARMAFPCFDEPLFKANFSIKIRRERRHIALSNMPKVKTIELEGGLLEDHFETTVKMSTYLVAYIVCDFKSVSSTTSSGVKTLLPFLTLYLEPWKTGASSHTERHHCSLIPRPLPFLINCGSPGS